MSRERQADDAAVSGVRAAEAEGGMTLLDLCETPVAETPDGTDFTAAVGRYMLGSGGRWVNAVELERIGGRHAWRTRLSEARRRYHFRTENRVRTVLDESGSVRYRVSEYRLAEAE